MIHNLELDGIEVAVKDYLKEHQDSGATNLIVQLFQILLVQDQQIQMLFDDVGGLKNGRN